MHAQDLRYYAFVSRFVDAVTGEAITTEMARSRQARRLFEQAHAPAAKATGTIPARKAA